MRELRSTFSTRFGFYMAAVGAAFGLGTFWRFPYIVGANGGGAFIVLYLFFVAAIAVPALICELQLGRTTGKNIVGALKGKYVWFGRLGILASFIILSYYAVVSGWVIHFIVQGLFGRFTSLGSRPELIIDQLSSKGFLQMALASVHLIVTASIVAKGVRNGIEKWSRIFMPILFIVLAFILVNSLFLPGTMDAFRFLFYPDFTKLTQTSVIEALGHALYTASLGFGGMIAYGSYLRKEVHIPSESIFVVSMDTIFSLLVGLLIFPIVFTADVDAGSGAVLLFKTMPVLFKQLALGYVIALAFFICLYFAALSASI
ncbi:MAG: sodium-dependent transporter, partial [Oligoflexia bacterium]|nr:sodium-dependent transporter [Oligoflexia bacterium]